MGWPSVQDELLQSAWELFTSWVDHLRPRGRQKVHYGHGLAKDLKYAGLDTSTFLPPHADAVLTRLLSESDRMGTTGRKAQANAEAQRHIPSSFSLFHPHRIVFTFA